LQPANFEEFLGIFRICFRIFKDYSGFLRIFRHLRNIFGVREIKSAKSSQFFEYLGVIGNQKIQVFFGTSRVYLHPFGIKRSKILIEEKM
jgi:hypothetical protein